MRSGLVVLVSALWAVCTEAKRPHVVVVVVDDLGYNDVSFHGSDQIPTPTIDRLAKAGVRLQRYHVNPVCSPTRASLWSGRATVSTGIYLPLTPGALNVGLNETCNVATEGNCVMFGEAMSRLSYRSTMVSKWHVGNTRWTWTPIGRGWSEYHGYLGGAEDYFTHTRGAPQTGTVGYDMWRNQTPAVEVKGQYSTEIFTGWAVETIQQHAPGQPYADQPMFLCLGWQTMHAPLQAPARYVDPFNSTIANEPRRMVAGMVTAMDQGMQNITEALEAAGMMNDTLIVFTTDNGGPANGFNENMASNMPLLGRKHTLYQGGVHGVGFISGAGIQPAQRGTVSDALVHVSDWYFTVQEAAMRGIDDSEIDSEASVAHREWLGALSRGEAASGDIPFDPDQDGMNVWDAVSAGAPSPRKEIVFYASPLNRTDVTGALISWPWKLIQGDDDFGLMEGNEWFQTPGLGFDNVSFTIKCPFPPPAVACDPTQEPCLFNIEQDPCEHSNLALSQPEELAELQARLLHFQGKASPDRSQGSPDAICSPNSPQHNGSWYPCYAVAHGSD